tara:strand:- start:320 stop:466 length:147 start_codon:yes stop_codon:yes gene_type:complete
MALDDTKAREFIDLFYKIDLDQDGIVTLDEIKSGIRKHPEGNALYEAL